MEDLASSHNRQTPRHVFTRNDRARTTDIIYENRAQIEKIVSQYAKTIDSYIGLFGYDPSRNVDTAKEYKEAFAAQPLAIQLKWLGELNDEISGLQAIYDKMLIIAPDQKAQFGTLRRHEKVEWLNLQEKFAAKLLCSSKKFQTIDLKDAHARFKSASLTEKAKMVAAIDSWLNFELDFVEKKLCKEYAEKLAAQQLEGVISEKTVKAYFEWFRNQTLNGKQDALSAFEAEMRPRIDLLEKFKKNIGYDLQKKELAEAKDGFYALGHSGREKRYAELLKLQQDLKKSARAFTLKQQTNTAKIDTGANNIDAIFLRARKAEVNQDYILARKLYEGILRAQGAENIYIVLAKQRLLFLNNKVGIQPSPTEPASSLSDAKLEEIISAVMASPQIKRTRINHTILAQFAVTAASSQKRQQSPRPGRRDLSSREEALQKSLSDKHGMVLDGDKKAVPIMTIDPGQLPKLAPEERFMAKQTAAALQASRKRMESTDSIRITSKGRTVSAEEAIAMAQASAGATRKKVVEATLALLQTSRAGTPTELSEQVKKRVNKRRIQTALN